MGFAEGFSTGASAIARGLQMRTDREDRARENAWVDEQRTRLRQDRAREDAAWNNLDTLQSQGVFDGATGLKQPSMQMLASGGTAYGTGDPAIREATGDYAREANRLGVPDQGGYNPQADITRRGASELELERAMGGISAARRDTTGMRQSADRQKVLRENELLAGAKVDDNTVKWLNQNHKALTLGDADKDGFRQLSFVDVDGKGQFSRLSLADQRKLAGAQALWDVNPDRAMKMVGEVNKDLATLFAHENAMSEQVGRSGNDVAGKRGELGIRRGELDVHRAHQAESTRHNMAVEGNAAAHLGLQRQQLERSNWMPEQYVDKDGNVRVFDVNRKSPGQPQFVEREMPGGLKPYNPRPPQETRVGEGGLIVQGNRVFRPDPKAPGGYSEVNLGPSRTEQALTEFLRRQKEGAGAGQGAQSAPPVRPPERYDMFEAMPDDELARYARAGNVLAKEVVKRRAAAPVPTMGFFQE